MSVFSLIDALGINLIKQLNTACQCQTLKMLYFFLMALLSAPIFLLGFFPQKQLQLVDNPEPPISLYDVNFNVDELYHQTVDKLVFVVIDALRYDFINEENLPFLFSKSQKEGCILSVNVESPTVTLPRIKALTTGSVPQFTDIFLNLVSGEIHIDSILQKAVAKGKKIVFYGDDTWLKLYPNLFTRSEGVSSFFVNDYIEVDKNVTRNVLQELNRSDWDMIFLHYLGLDHIGHISGPHSPLIKLKLLEMDEVIKAIYQASRESKTLIVFTGDHGMKDGGSHGGATLPETTVPFVVIGIPCENGSAAQTDIPATLSVLFGLQFPSGSIGKIISNFLTHLPVANALYAWRYNALSLMAKLNLCEGLFEEATENHYLYLKNDNNSFANLAKSLYQSCAGLISDKLIRKSVEQNIEAMIISCALLIYFVTMAFLDLFVLQFNNNKLIRAAEIILVLLQAVFMNNLIGMVISLSSILILIILNLKLAVIRKIKLNCDISTLQIVGTSIHSLSFLSSSFIEEEHQVWYFLWGTFVLISAHQSFQHSKFHTFFWVLIFIELRFLRTLNQTGDKWAFLPDLSDWLEENFVYFQAFFITGLMLVFICCYNFYRKTNFNLFLCSVSLISTFIFRSYFPQSPLLGKIIWLLIALNLVMKMTMKNVIVTWLLFCSLLMRPYNIILLPACVGASEIINKSTKSVFVLCMAHIWLGNVLFFCQGHGNNFGSVDIAAGYIGLDDYQPLLVIAQTVCHTYAFPILAHLIMLDEARFKVKNVWNLIMFCCLLRMTVVYALTFVQRHHLFIWTVFTPKLLIETIHSLIVLIELILYYAVVKVKSYFIYKIK